MKSAIQMTNKEAFEIAFAILVLLLISRLSYIEGMKDEQFDRATANHRLQECLDVVSHNRKEGDL